MHSRSLAIAAVLCLLTALAGCGLSASPAQHATSSVTSGTPSCQPQCATLAAAAHVRVFVEPAARATPILDAIRGARTSLWMGMYLLTSLDVIHALEDAHNRGVDVRVMLEPHPFGSGPDGQLPLIAELNTAGVSARATSPAFTLTHEKIMLVDAATAYIMTGNLTKSALGGSSATTNREYGIIATNAATVSDVRASFQADWDRQPYSPVDPALVVSPTNSRIRLLTLIAIARSSLSLEEEELFDPQIMAALVAAARRGVSVRLLLPGVSGSGDSTERANVAALTAAGGMVRRSARYYIHAKLIVADANIAFVGSENISVASLDQNREMGIIVSDTTAITTFEACITDDWTNSVAA
ncbi:MAG TPA: phospholipase D-like domain-containing protein [Ktedonobacterales bacterium]